jgi:RHS repeat-associated protein
MRRFGHFLMVLAAIVGLLPAMAFSQVATGTPLFGSFAGGPDIINESNLNVHWNFPIFSRAGRALPFGYTLGFDNSVWRVVTDDSAHTSWQPPENGVFGWTRETDVVTGYVTYEQPGYASCDGHPLYTNWVYHDPSGTAHTFSKLDGWRLWVSNPPGCSTPYSDTGVADDGSGYKITISAAPSAIVIRPSGGYISPPVGIKGSPNSSSGAAWISDSNGNYISTSDGLTFTDTLGPDAQGNNVLTINAGWFPYPNSLTYQSPFGPKQVTISYTTMNLQTNFGCQDVAEYSANGVPMLTAINYPDGSSYQFGYEPTPGNPANTTGRLASVTLPTGGTVSYSYWGGEGSLHGIFCDGTTAAFTRTISDGTNTTQKSFWIAENADGTTTTHTDSSAGDETVVSFSGGHETQRQIYQGLAPPTGGGMLLETIITCWNGVSSGTCGPGATVTQPITGKFTYTQLPEIGSRHDEYFNSNGLTTRTDDYDWGYGYLGHTEISYATNLGDIVDRPASVTTFDAAGNQVAQTMYGYDDYSVHGLVLTDSYTPAPPNHSPWQQVTTSRGNLTSVSEWVTGTTFLTKQFTYFDTGMLNTTIDVNGAVTTYNYPTSDPSNTTCGFAFPNSVSLPPVNGITLTTSTTWNCDGGVAVSTTDPNLNTKSVTMWDQNFWRPTQTQDELGFQTNITYTPAVTSPSFSPAVAESTFTFNNGHSVIDGRTTLDGLGRTHIVQRRQGPVAANYDSVETQYDSYGRPNLTTIGYVGTVGQGYCASRGLPSGCTAPGTTTNYDALSRPTLVTDAGGGTMNYSYTGNVVFIEVGPLATGDSNTKRRQYRYNARGWLTDVCELATNQANGTCGMSPGTAYWGFQTHYAYDGAGRLTQVTQNMQQGAPGSQQTRTFGYDGLGRMTQEINPETGMTNYSYDSGGGCGITYPGDLVAKSDANGNLLCNYYDALHRLYQTLYFGPAAGVTPARVFVYDTPTVSFGAQNVKGRLARAFNCFSPCPTAVTDESFSYSARGETIDVYESTLHSGGYYHVTGSYWENGAPKTLSNLSGLPAITYGGGGLGLDGEGRVTRVQSTGIQNRFLVGNANGAPGVSYVISGTTQPIGVLTRVTFGSGDSDQFSYDVNTGRLTNYTFNVVSNPAKTDSGTLAWNANGSLRQLAILDTVPGAIDTQTCNYTHDDLGRIASVDCGQAIWQQNFSYDPFGNITKTVPQGGTGVAFPPSTNAYDTATNRINYTGYSYDYDGNLVTDATGNHSYQWNADGKPYCIDGVVLTYDPLGRMAEQARGGSDCNHPGASYQEIVYGPGGNKLALMSGQSLVKAVVPLPGGATAVYNSFGLAYYRHSDHLGSSRLATTPGHVPYYTGAYAPFGENYRENGTIDRSFTAQNQDTVSGLNDFMYREHTPNQGRWISADPAGRTAVTLTDPQSWNRYAYVNNQPMTKVDSLGLCDVFIAGVKRTPSNPATIFEDFTNAMGMETVYPYSGGNVIGGVWDVGKANMGFETEEVKAVVAAINLAANDPGPINIFADSGGASAFATARHYISPQILARINNVTYVDPGALGGAPLPGGNGDTTMLQGKGIINGVVQSPANYPLGVTLVPTPCLHDLDCVLGDSKSESLIEQKAGNSCSTVRSFTRGGNVAGVGAFEDPFMGGNQSDLFGFLMWSMDMWDIQASMEEYQNEL